MAGHGMSIGTPVMESVGPITFGPDDVLFVADNRRTTIFALDVADAGPAGGAEPFDLDGLDSKLAAFLGCRVKDVYIRDLAVHPRTHNVYLSVMRGGGQDAMPVIVRIDRLDASIGALALDGIVFSQWASMTPRRSTTPGSTSSCPTPTRGRTSSLAGARSGWCGPDPDGHRHRHAVRGR